METIYPNQIKEYCEEALEITDKLGVNEGLAFLVGKKFCRVLHSLRKAQNKAKFLYGSEYYSEDGIPFLAGGQDLKLNYALTLQSNYKELLEEIRSLEVTQDGFVREIKECFELEDIKDYLNDYPRLGFSRQKQDSQDHLKIDAASILDTDEIFLEVDDIFMVEEVKKLFA